MTETKPTVFILDDDLSIQDSLTMLVATMDLSSQCYATADEFLDSYDPTQPGCLILDVRLPGMSGLDCLKKLRSDGSDIPVIIVTGHGDKNAREKAIEYGVIDILEKPFFGQHMSDLIRQTVETEGA